MSNALPPYPAYKNSGVPWFGDVPVHWTLWRLDKLFTLRHETPHDDDQRVTGYLDGRVTLRSNVLGQKIKGVIKEAGWQRIHPGDFAISGMNAHLGGMGVSDSLGKCSPIYLILKPKPTVNAQYVAHAVRRAAHSGALKSLVNTIRFNSADFKREDLKRILVFLPPEDEQSAIVDYIGYADRQIRRLIRAKRRTIELLNEQKKAIIHQAVTRGLDPNVPLKPSGVEWLGDVPAHWGVTKLQRLTTGIGDGLHGTPEYVDDSRYRFINGNNLVDGSIKLFPNTRCVSENEFRKYYIPLNGSTALMSINGTIGSVALYQGEEVILGKSAAYINCDNDLDRSYLSYFLQSPGVRQYFKLQVSGTTIFNLSLASIRRLRISLPPLAEQLEISAFLQNRMAGLTKAIERVRDEIDLIREYHTRLIADVATGKIDVRDVALPEDVIGEDKWADDNIDADETDEETLELDEEEPVDD